MTIESCGGSFSSYLRPVFGDWLEHRVHQIIQLERNEEDESLERDNVIFYKIRKNLLGSCVTLKSHISYT